MAQKYLIRDSESRCKYHIACIVNLMQCGVFLLEPAMHNIHSAFECQITNFSLNPLINFPGGKQKPSTFFLALEALNFMICQLLSHLVNNSKTKQFPFGFFSKWIFSRLPRPGWNLGSFGFRLFSLSAAAASFRF